MKNAESSKSVSEYTTMRECLLRDIHNLMDQRDFAVSEMERLEQERDEARDKIKHQAERIRILEGATNHDGGLDK